MNEVNETAFNYAVEMAREVINEMGHGDLMKMTKAQRRELFRIVICRYQDKVNEMHVVIDNSRHFDINGNEVEF
jgi:isocitrate dehydrogenase